MSKPIIAIDIDDVLAASAEGFLAWSNEKYGTNLAVQDYTEHWAELWQTDLQETERRSLLFHTDNVVKRYRAHDEAKRVLQKLHRDYTLLAITSRRILVEKATREWIARHYRGVFDDIQFSGIYDAGLHPGMLKQTKGSLFAKSKVSCVIDDQPKHCLAAVDLGIKAVLYGDYPWNQLSEMPPLLTRGKDWAEVEAYFEREQG